MAKDRLAEAELLYANDFLQGAYYIGGYAVECSLKALICKRLGVEVFFSQKGFPVDGNSTVAKSLQIHELPALLVFAGLHPALRDSNITGDVALFKSWSRVSAWTEQRRYEPLTCDKQTVYAFLQSVKHIMQWVETHY